MILSTLRSFGILLQDKCSVYARMRGGTTLIRICHSQHLYYYAFKK